MPGLTILHGCRTLQLNDRFSTLVDETEFASLTSINWQVQTIGTARYARFGGNGWKPLILLHRMIADAPKEIEVDHINGDGLDNRRENLRLATRQQNGSNRLKHKPSGHDCRFKGIFWGGYSWRAVISARRTKTYLGSYGTQEEAARAYDAAARLLHGNFARTNADMFGDY